MKKKSVFHSEMMLYSARGFFEIGWEHAINMNQMSDKEKAEKISAIAMNLSFCAEILLKYLCISEGTPVPYTHKLNKLFNRLSAEMREKVEKEFYTMVVDRTASEGLEIFMLYKNQAGKALPEPNMQDLPTFLMYHNDAFSLWRYIFQLYEEEYEVFIDLHSFHCFIKALESQV